MTNMYSNPPNANALCTSLEMSAQHGSSNSTAVYGRRPSLDSMRAYRACIHCRSRKTRCDLDANGGRPPCRRCQREQRECILGESHRGGRRVRKKSKLDDENKSTTVTAHSQTHSFNSGPRENNNFVSFRTQAHESYTNRDESAIPWSQGAPPDQSRSLSSADSDTTYFRRESIDQPTASSHYVGSHRALSLPSVQVSGGIASADLQNPSDALDILAQVADGESTSGNKRATRPSGFDSPISPEMGGDFSYRPLAEGLISREIVYALFESFQNDYHPFFPIPPKETFNLQRLPRLSRVEPHLFSAILTVASQENDRVHQACHDHMQQLVSSIVSGADVGVEAVEALLLLSHWVSHKPQAHITVGRGEEDRQAWMYIGTAVRLGFFLGIDRTAFKTDLQKDHPLFVRNKLAWVACYVCDRSVAVRLGRGFWARGPGPLSGLRAPDFLSLQPLAPDDDNWAAILQANLELTQIFSNVHDILYCSKGHGWKDMLEGRYAKYLDDFRASIRTWNDTWGTLICSPRLKASLLLSYDYLRLYVNAFAYQATVSRAMTFSKESRNSKQNRSIPYINASTPDARSIYDAIDAAKSLLSTFNSFVDPEILRYMPSHYYLYIIYSAVFLYKARATTTMAEEERAGLRHMITQTIERLQKSSIGANNMGTRYARLLQLLWRRAPKKPNPNTNPNHSSSLNPNPPKSLNRPQMNSSNNPPHFASPTTQAPPFENSPYAIDLSIPTLGETDFSGSPSKAFSWLDLGATWSFATQNNNGSAGSAGSAGEWDMDEQMMGEKSRESFDMGLLTDYRFLNEDNPNLIF